VTATQLRGQLAVYAEPAELRAAVGALRATGRPVHFVPTMGALHTGHRELVRQAGAAAGAGTGGAATVVSIFVNPLQFGPGEDLDRYPRTLDDDLAVCAEEGVDLVFTPTVATMYPPGATTTVHPGPLGAELEGRVRPVHFAGVLTVVAKLFNMVTPDRAYFGEKDYQQLVLIRRMARDLDIPVEVLGVPTVRELDGLALSSRNVYLSPAARRAASRLPAALRAAAAAAHKGADAVLAAAAEELAHEPQLAVEYLELRDPELGPAALTGAARLLVAARLGTTRLIDNVSVALGVGE
jgi:pantoate--beta-alanine ligase